MKRIIFWVILKCLFAPIQSKAASGFITYSGMFYSSISEEVIRADNPNVYSVNLVKRKPEFGNSEDFGTVCLADIEICSRIEENSTLYRKDENGNFIIHSVADKIIPLNISNWNGYESFPLCGISEGTHSNNYGGQCYVSVLSNGSRTIALQFFVGKNKGCRDMKKCFADRMKTIRAVVNSSLGSQ
ncbi:hypothetical protein [Paraherbaspirillum soli]|uniref:DUF4468 domain-containing protein n=1 Tax=Paraherbaspirillum soli TaxID=631222 RepID=A0ABW0MA03_9BURK